MEEPTCEICGRKGVKAVVSVEGARLVVCGSCARDKKVLHFLEERESATGAELRPRVRKTEETEELVENYGKILRRAREKMRLPLSVVAERINEKESYLEKIEREEMVPTFAVARKLEKELGITLIEKVSASVAPAAAEKKRFSEPTLGDMLESQGGE